MNDREIFSKDELIRILAKEIIEIKTTGKINNPKKKVCTLCEGCGCRSYSNTYGLCKDDETPEDRIVEYAMKLAELICDNK